MRHRLAGLVLNDGSAVLGHSIDDELADAQPYEVTVLEIAINREIEQ